MRLPWEERREFFQDARRARYLARLAGKAADLIVAMSLWHIPGAAGALAALFYVLMCDGFPGGRSLGKWLTGLKVVRIDREGMDFASSMMRNASVASPFLLYLFPVIGPFLAYTLGGGGPPDRDVPRVLRPGRAAGGGHLRRDPRGGAPAGFRCQPSI